MSNQRRSFRISLAAQQRGAKLRVGGRDYKVVLEDESAGGFAVSIRGSLSVKPGQKLRLRTSAGWSIVRVIHSTCQAATTRIGLERLEDLPDSETLREIKGSWSSYLPGADYCGIVWAACFAAAVAATLGIAWYGAQPSARHAWTGRPTGANPMYARFVKNFSQDFQDRWNAAEKAGTRIELTGDQQRKIEKILAQAEQDILQLRSENKLSPAVQAERMQAAEAEILAVLDEEQRSHWDQLASGSAEASKREP